jgi:integrase
MKRIKTYLAQAILKPDTKDTYRRNLGYFASWWNGKSASRVTPEDFTEFLSTKPTWGDSQRHTCLSALQAYIKFAYGEKDRIRRTREILLFRIRREEPGKQRTLTLDEVEELMQCCDLKRPAHMRDIAMLLVSLDCRLRSKEVCNLKIGEIDFDTKTLETRRKDGKQAAGKFGSLVSAFLQA